MAKFKQMNKSELLKLVTEVSTSLKTIGAAELSRLAKADPSAPPEGSIGSPEGSSSSSSSSGSPGEGSEGSEGGIPGGDPSAAPPGMDPSAGGPPPGADPSAAPAGPPPGADPSAAPPGAEGQAPAGPSFEELVSLYAALPPPDLEAHAAALQQAVAMKQGGAGAPPGAPPAGPPGASPSAPPAGPPGASPSAPPFGKQEVATHNPNIGLEAGGGTPGKVETANPNIGPTKKSEEDLLARLVKSEENFKALGEVVEKILTIPQRKAVTGLTIIPMRKTETPAPSAKKPFSDLTKAELHKALVTATDPRNGKLSKAERDVVTEYCLNPVSVDLSAIESIYNKS